MKEKTKFNVIEKNKFENIEDRKKYIKAIIDKAILLYMKNF